DMARAAADFATLDARGARVAKPGMRAWAGFAEFAVDQRDAALAYFDGIADSVRDDLLSPVLLQTGKALVQLGRLTEAVAPFRRARSLAACQAATLIAQSFGFEFSLLGPVVIVGVDKDTAEPAALSPAQAGAILEKIAARSR